jgi:hypothetical protein
MNYLELINKCLVELNYKQVYTFPELTKNDHKKIKNILNVINTEICTSERWHFLLRQALIELSAGVKEIENTINGRISTLLIDGTAYEYFEDFERFFKNSQPAHTYSVFNNKILLPAFKKDKIITVIYYSKDHAFSAEDEEKPQMEEAEDKSVIPEPFVEPLLVYGTCMRLKGNPQHIRFNYWYSMYKDALSNMRSRICVNADESPSIKMRRQ